MGRKRAGLAFVIALAVAAPGAEAQSPAPAAGQVLTFTDEVPCPPSSAARPRVAHVRHRIARKRRVLRKAVVSVRRAPPRRVPVKHVVRRRRPTVVRVAAPVAPTRCSVIRRERLTMASFALRPDVAELTPIVDDVQPGGPVLTALTSGRPALPNIINPTGGGGQTSVTGSVSAAPEPGEWLLMLFGIAALGAALRRGRGRKEANEIS